MEAVGSLLIRLAKKQDRSQAEDNAFGALMVLMEELAGFPQPKLAHSPGERDPGGSAVLARY